MALCACSAARGPATARDRACEVLTLLGKAIPGALAADAAGGIALAGESAGGLLRAGGVTLDAAGGFVLRTDPYGTVRWMRPLGPLRPLALTVMADGGVVVAGQAQRRCFALRLDESGRELWSSKLGLEGESACRALALDPASGDLWAAGEFNGAIGTVRSAGLSDAFVVRIAGLTGEMRLLRTFGGKGTDAATALAMSSGAIVVGGSFGADVDASVAEVNFGRGVVSGAGGADGFLVALSPEGVTRWVSVLSERGEDEVVALAAREGAVYAAANLHRERKGAPCGGQVAVLRKGEWVRVREEPCLSARSLAFDESGRLWTLENAGRTLRAQAFSPRDGEPLGERTWTADPATVRGIALASVPGGLAIAATTDGEMLACGKAVGNAGEQTAFLLWIRDL